MRLVGSKRFSNSLLALSVFSIKLTDPSKNGNDDRWYFVKKNVTFPNSVLKKKDQIKNDRTYLLEPCTKIQNTSFI